MNKKYYFSEVNRLLINDLFLLLIPIASIKLWSLNNSTIVFLTSTFTIGFILFSKLSGKITEKFNKLKIPIYSNVVFILILILFIIFTNLNIINNISLGFLIILCSFITSLLEVNTGIIIPTYFSKNLKEINGNIQLIRSLVNFISPILAFAFSKNITFTFLVIIIISFINILLYKNMVFNIKEKCYIKNKPSVHNDPKMKSIFYIMQNKNLITSIISTIGINIAMTMITSTYIIYFMKNFEITENKIGIYLSIISLGGILGSLFAKFIINKVDFSILYKFSITLLSLPVILSLFNYSLIFIIIGLFFSYFSRSYGSIFRTTIQQIEIDESRRSSVFSTIYMVTWGVIPLAGYLTSFLLNFITIPSVINIAIIIFIISNIFYVFFCNSDKYLQI